MRMPESLTSLADYGLIQEVIRPLMSGKEAQIYLVISEGEERVAKVYREADHRNFKHRSEYTEGRTTRSTRDQRAMAKRSRYGRDQDEAAWRAAEVDILYRLFAAGVRVPKPHHFTDGVLLMELVKGAGGEPAPRLGDISVGADEATRIHEHLIREVVRMLCADVIHGDLSEFNVLMDSAGPVIIDFPQSIEASRNPSARKLLLRDVENLHVFHRRFAPRTRSKPYAEEMWQLYQSSSLTPDTPLRGHFEAPNRKVNLGAVMGLVEDADRDEARRRERLGLAPTHRRRGQRRKKASPGVAPQGAAPTARTTPSDDRAQRPADAVRAEAGGGRADGGQAPRPPRRRRRRRAGNGPRGPEGQQARSAPSARGEGASKEPRRDELSAPAPKQTEAADKQGTGAPKRRRRRRRRKPASTTP